jgi:hypothetical protein
MSGFHCYSIRIMPQIGILVNNLRRCPKIFAFSAPAKYPVFLRGYLMLAPAPSRPGRSRGSAAPELDMVVRKMRFAHFSHNHIQKASAAGASTRACQQSGIRYQTLYRKGD